MNQDTALKLLKAGENVFLTGSAGAGKTYTLNQYIQYLRVRQVPVAITASTGIAATHMGGKTIHTWAGIGIKDDMTDHDLKNLKERKHIKDQLENVQVLIIDEISMLHGKQLNLVNRVLKYFKGTDEPFGGIQIVVSGDFFQLPPVGKKEELNRDKFCFMSQAWVEAKFRVCYLSEQHRQGDDILTQILNAIRAQTIQSEHIQALEQTYAQNIGDTFTRLYTHNANVDRINEQYLQQIQQPSQVFTATKQGNTKILDMLLSSIRTSEELELKKQAKVMFVKNNFDLGYINGSLGEVIDFVEDDDKNIFPKVRLVDGEIITVQPETWSIESDEGDVLASFTQIPLRLAWAITIHKSQGMTLDAAEVDLSKTFEKGQGYVALSRLKALSGLRLLGFNTTALELDSLAIKADRRFQELSQEAELHFAGRDLTSHHLAFMRHCGGLTNQAEIDKNIKKLKQQPFVASVKTDTYLRTKELYEQGLDIVEIADERQLSPATIIGHLTRLHREQGLDVERIRPDDEIIEQVRKIYKKLQKRHDPDDFMEDGQIKLKSIVEMTAPYIGYDDVRLALLFVV